MAVPVRDNRHAEEWAGHRRPWHRTAVQPLGLVVMDLVCMTFTSLMAGQEAARVALAAVLIVALNAVGRGYEPRVLPSSLDRGFWLAGSGLVAALAAFWGSASPAVVGLSCLLFTFLAFCGRCVFHAAVRGARRRGATAQAVIVGAGRHGQRLAVALLGHPEYGLLPVGFVDEGEDQDSPLPVLGRPADLREIVSTHGARTVVITGQNQATARTARSLGCEVYLAPEPGDVLVDFVPLREHVRSFALLRMRPDPQARLSWPLKRVLDVAVAVVGLVVSAPIMAVCATVVRWEIGPGVLFRQRRVGYGGTPIELIKLRTLKPVDAHESATRWSIADDDRLGPAGRTLRRTSLDELPQLWNVLKGDMSIVGPRPERPYFVDQFSSTTPGYNLRHRVPVGITGWAQIHGLRGDTSIEDRARFDNHYIDDWSFRADLKILLRTAWSMLRPGGS
ncbi:sugar transferase [Nonomuraea sp. NPDC049152]|uniref:sugar transferase n=1 Tax=Nonomuraea sp. NPDC049152 TaxID=3154350 RepID=UPI0033EAC30C